MTEADSGSGRVSRRAFLTAGAVGLGLGGVVVWQTIDQGDEEPSDVLPRASALVAAGFPRAFFFRMAEGAARRLSYQEWEQVFSPLGGVLAKGFGEVFPAGADTLEYLRHFKRDHPNQAVLVHFSGAGRVRSFDTDGFFAGHWLHRAGTKLLTSVDQAESTLVVEDPRVFRAEVGRFGDRGDDVVIARVADDGEIDWGTAEQVQVLTREDDESAITVNRGAYGTVARAWPEGSYLAAHVVSGPFGRESADHELLWSYNYSTECPRDDAGRTCADALVDDLVEKFGPGGSAETLDGVQFDVLFSDVVAPTADVDGDGIADGGVTGDVDSYAIGTTLFTQELRRRLPSKILMADGNYTRERINQNLVRRHQRGFEHLNGIETEGFLTADDRGVAGFSEGLNILEYWRDHSAEPSLSYINHKFADETPESINYARARLVFAAATFVDAAITYTTAPPTRDPQRHRVGIFDELWKGEAQEPNWLGRPVGDAQHLAARAPDVLKGTGVSWSSDLVTRLRGGVAFNHRGDGAGIRVEDVTTKRSGDELERWITWQLERLDVESEDIYVELSWAAEPHRTYPATMARAIRITAVAAGESQIDRVWGYPGTPARFILRDVGPGPVDLNFRVEGDQPVDLTSLTVHAATDGVFREFDNGVVFANPSNRPYDFDLSALLPGVTLRRLVGAAEQDPQTNSGERLGRTLRLGPLDGLFAIRE